ncbi:MAG: transposase, partial [Bacteroidetes bacterium]|nr:transposase [Bacteroidota bacterium]
HGLTEIIRQLKTFSSKRINKIRNTVSYPVWQRNYYERIIRNGNELNNIRDYIENNIIQWSFDKEYPQNI